MTLDISLTTEELVDVLNERRSLPIPADYEVETVEQYMEEPRYHLRLRLESGAE